MYVYLSKHKENVGKLWMVDYNERGKHWITNLQKYFT